jgi:hypothetical protein
MVQLAFDLISSVKLYHYIGLNGGEQRRADCYLFGHCYIRVGLIPHPLIFIIFFRIKATAPFKIFQNSHSDRMIIP